MDMESLEIPGVGTLTRFGALLVGEWAVVADLHIGYEYELGRSGTALPDIVLPGVLEGLRRVKETHGVECLAVAGDFKHSFSKESGAGWRAIDAALEGISSLFGEVHIIRGNHDNYLLNHIKRRGDTGIVWHEDHMLINGLRVFHGYREAPPGDGWMVMGHEHPAVVLSDDLAVKGRFRSYMILDGARILVLPSFNTVMPGVDVGSLLSGDALSPVLRGADTDRCRVVAITDEGLIAPYS